MWFPLLILLLVLGDESYTKADLIHVLWWWFWAELVYAVLVTIAREEKAR